MLDAKFIRENEDAIRDTIKRQKKEELLAVVDEILAQDKRWRELKQSADNLRADRNKVSQEINKTKKAGGDIKPLLAQAKEIPVEIKQIEEKMQGLEKDMRARLAKVPNVMHPDVPYGKSDEDNVEQKKWGTIKEFDFPIKNHVELCEDLGIADFEASAKTSGNGSWSRPRV